MIEIKDISFSYPNGIEALKEVKLTIDKGEFIALMGENGAGKTTLVKHLNGLLKPTKGDVMVDGVNTKKTSVAKLSRKVGFVFQNPDHQLFSETVEEEISFALRNFGFEEKTMKRKTAWVLDLLDLTRYSQISPFTLSGGERKRVAIASVLAWDPEVFVIDEPTIGQDIRQKENLLHFLFQLKAQGKTVIIVTHDVEFVAECAPRILLMTEGKIVADGNAKEILTDYSLTRRASIMPPQITQIFLRLSDLNLPKKVINVREAESIILDLKRSDP